MYVRPEVRGTGLAAALVARVAEQARGAVEEVQLTVVTSNTAAVRLYTRAGFSQYGLERRALKIGTQYYDEALMALPFGTPPYSSADPGLSELHIKIPDLSR